MNKTIVLGGTFNPIHRGHVELAVKAHEIYGLPVIIMPSGDPSSYKSVRDIASAKHRVRMAELAVQNFSYMSVSTIEVKRPGRTYTADTLKVLKDEYDEIYFIIGADSFFALPEWYKPEYICAHCHLLVAGRDDHSEEEMLANQHLLKQRFHAKIDFLHMPNMPYSSTMIRENVSDGIDIANQVPVAVAEYIYTNHLYVTQA